MLCIIFNFQAEINDNRGIIDVITQTKDLPYKPLNCGFLGINNERGFRE